MEDNQQIVLIIGSAPDAIRAIVWNKSIFDSIVAINNAWKIRNDWDYLVYPDDFPLENAPHFVSPTQSTITAKDFVPAQNNYGGFVYAGGTMAFTTAYWALGTLRPRIMAFIGCDMIYPKGGQATHFYGMGTPDPLRHDISLQSLEAKSARLLYMANQQKCLCLNLSDQAQSSLVFPRADISSLEEMKLQNLDIPKAFKGNIFNNAHITKAIKREIELGYYFESGRYWEHLDNISADECLAIDRLWKKALIPSK